MTYDNPHDLLVHYGYDRGTVLERIDEICAGLIEASEKIKRLKSDNAGLVAACDSLQSSVYALTSEIES